LLLTVLPRDSRLLEHVIFLCSAHASRDMVIIDNNFTQAVLEDEDKHEGTNIDANIAAGKRFTIPLHGWRYSHAPIALPEGAKIVWVSTMGATHWSILTKIDTIVDGKPRSFFLKEYRDANAKGMIEAELESTATLYTMALDNVPRPLAYGLFAADSKRFFYLQSFCHMTDAPSQDEIFISKLVALLAEIHRKDSPTGKFGFHITSALSSNLRHSESKELTERTAFQGNIPNNNQWCDTWEEYFSRKLSNLIDLERAIHGTDPKMDVLSSALMRKVVPRLLRPMETGSNKIKPVLLHGDM
jgi:protein-ribulosamine 3-kinase